MSRWPWVWRGTHDAECRRLANALAVAEEGLALERHRLSEAFTTMSALRLAGAAPAPTPIPVPTQDAVSAAIAERATRYPAHIRRTIMQRMGGYAMDRLAAGEDREAVAAEILAGTPLDNGVPG